MKTVCLFFSYTIKQKLSKILCSSGAETAALPANNPNLPNIFATFFFLYSHQCCFDRDLSGWFCFFSQSISKSSQILCFLNNLRITLPSRLYLYLSLLRINEWGFSKKGGNLCLLVGDIKYHKAFWHGFKKRKKKNEKKKKKLS